MRRPALTLLLRTPPTDATPDGELLAEYVARRDPVAFERLVRRHAGTVWHVCRRVAGNPHDAEDAFQATFLVLVRSARSVSGSLGAWLYGVAFRVASKARVAAARRNRREATAARTEATDPPELDGDLTAAVHAELAALPDRYRLPILLCDIEGLTRTDAAVRLGWKEGTLSGRLNRARKRLAERLSARGITAAGGVLAAGVVSGPATAAVETVLGWARTETLGLTPNVVALANGVKRDMALKLLSRVTILSAAVLAALGVGVYGLLPEPQTAAAPVPKVEAVKEEDITADRLDLLINRRVQREIKMTAEQRVKLLDGLDELLDGLRAEHDAAELPRVSPGRGGPPRVERDYDAEQRAFERKKQAFAATVITAKQLARLQEVEVQLMGEFAPINRRVAEALKMTDQQRKRVVEVLRGNEDYEQQMQQLVRPPTRTFKTPARMRELVEAELTAAQRKVWADLAGEKAGFDVDKNQSDFGVRGRYRVFLRPEGWVDTSPKKGGVGR